MLGCKSVCLQFNNKQEVKSIILRGWNVGVRHFTFSSPDYGLNA